MAFPSVTTSIATEITTAVSGAVTINKPSTRVPGHLFVCLLRRTGAGTHTYPAGWVKLAEDSSDASDDVTSIAYKQIEENELSTFQMTPSTGTEKVAAIVWQIKDAHNAGQQPPELSTVAVGTSTTPNPTTVTPTGGAKDYLFLWLGGWENEQTSPPTSQPTNYASGTPDRIGANTGTAGAVATNCRVAGTTRQLNAASEDPGSWTISVSDDWTAWAMAIHPAPPGGEEKPEPIFRPKKGYF